MLVSQVSSAVLTGTTINSEERNLGIAFGLLPSHTVVFFLLLSIATLCLFVLAVRIRYLATPVSLILAGGTSNGLDRMILGFVRDPVHIASWSGNVADILIGVGVLWAIFTYSRR